MDPPRIRDIPTIAKTLEDARQMATIKGCLPFFRPLLKAFNVDVDGLDQSLRAVDGLREETEALARVPDEFNKLLANRGWIIHADMNLEVAKRAVNVANSGDVGAADEILVAYYGPNEIEWMLRRMNAVAAFRPRMRLAELAFVDYREGRLHACIPVVLALLDGMVSEVHSSRRGFFAQEGDLKAWDSIAAHNTGLNVLADLFKKGRRKTNTEPITVPYRHGIMHGWDMAYDNELVAAKTWGALFATREWALKAEQGSLEQPDPPVEPTWSELMARVRKNQQAKEMIESWEPRTISVGVDIPATGALADYEVDSPEAALVKFLELWRDRNYGFIAQHLGAPFGHNWKPAFIKAMLSDRKLTSFELREVTEEAPAGTEIAALLTWDKAGIETQHLHTFRMIYWHPGGEIAIRGVPGGLWTIMNWSV